MLLESAGWLKVCRSPLVEKERERGWVSYVLTPSPAQTKYTLSPPLPNDQLLAMRPTAIVALLPLLAASCVSAFPSMARVDAMERSRIQEAMQQAREVVDLMKREQVLQKRQDTNAAPVMVPDPNGTEHQFQGEQFGESPRSMSS
jgi:hypothetical protein